jgi:transcriptional regulator with XRE-family HTH domain
MEDNKITAYKFAKLIGVTPGNLAPFLHGKTSSIKTINRIIKATGLTYEEIMKEEIEA